MFIEDPRNQLSIVSFLIDERGFIKDPSETGYPMTFPQGMYKNKGRIKSLFKKEYSYKLL